MPRERHINAGPETSRLRTALGVPARLLRGGIWALQDRVAWPLIDRLRAVAEALRWPLQRLAWGAEEKLVWPARERIAGWDDSRRIAGGLGLAAVAAAAVALGLIVASEKEPAPQPRLAVATHASVATPPAAPAAREPEGPTLQGPPPEFGLENGVKITSAAETEASVAPVSGDSETEAELEPAEGEEAGAGTSGSKPAPAGPAAMKVARRFAQAFVFYEVGERPQRAKTIFEETAVPQLADALADRPPRLPADAEVPQARVLNLVPGPRRAKAYTVSVSLLRVGVTSELRLKMKRRDGAWVVTDVRG